MEIPTELKKQLLNELEFVVKKVKEETDLTRKLYFLSAASGAISRTIRYYMENELLIAQTILSATYAMLNDRVNRLKSGDDAVQLPEKWPDQIVEFLSELVKAISENKSVYPALEKMLRLAHSGTGPGYYIEMYQQSVNAS